MAAQARGTDPRAELLAMVRLATDRFAKLSKGIEAYHSHPYCRDMPLPQTLWRGPGLRLLDYGLSGHSKALPLLIVPSVINRHYILDLRPGQSFVRWLAGAGLRPLVVAWDDLQASADTATIDGCVLNALEPALAETRKLFGKAPLVLGYCLGGLLALALAHRLPDEIRGLVFMATPWDFHVGGSGLSRTAHQASMMMEPLLSSLGALPIDAVQTLFYSLDPFHVVEKFIEFADIDPTSEHAKAFVALEDWLNDGLAMPAAIARTLLGEWYATNTPATGAWKVSGQAIRPSEVQHQSLVLVPTQDRIVPPLSAQALGAALPRATTLLVESGHIGMVSSRRAEQMVWAPLLQWINQTFVRPSGSGSSLG